MKFSKLDLLTLLISLFLFSSCKDSSSLGLDIDPANAIKGTLLDTVTVSSRTETDIPTNTYSTGAGMTRYPLGVMSDDVFGTTTASLAMSVNLPVSASSGTGEPYYFGKSPVIDSVILVLPYYRTAVAGVTAPYNEFYGDSTAVYTVKVNQLNLNLSTQTGFLSNKTYSAGDLLGTFSGAIKPNTRVSVIDVLTGAKDTVVSALPQLRIKLDANLIKNKIVDVDSVLKNTNTRFNNIFNGLKITATTTKKGGIMFFNFGAATTGVSGASNLEIYYRKQGTTALLRDTAVARFPILTTTNPVAATVTHDYANTDVAKQLSTPGEYQTTYLQAMGGLRNKITFPYLKNLVSRIGSKIVINKAELVVDISNGADSIPFKIAPRLALYRYDIAEQRQQIPDNNPYNASSNPTGDVRTASSGFAAAFGGYYNYTKKSYTFVITNYIQDLVDGKTVDYGTYLAPTSYTEFNVFPFPTSAGRAVIGSFNNTANRKIRLNIYYVKAGQ
jgi:hypothetical protein